MGQKFPQYKRLAPRTLCPKAPLPPSICPLESPGGFKRDRAPFFPLLPILCSKAFEHWKASPRTDRPCPTIFVGVLLPILLAILGELPPWSGQRCLKMTSDGSLGRQLVFSTMSHRTPDPRWNR
ncbi:hypothetical protein MPNT_10037 [Candidatus Methylacidithermus pantelleriae]|uniref:Uncharacterized protein n=1 Tax=Candidatus Methylacidithermus pantelleriae TaxID=2744239 RepID=A0A8J2BLD5_9BACT|nr:hypothetical protein MPNT_10037 [Candidatus Methylacidithermus pantelleriae]